MKKNDLIFPTLLRQTGEKEYRLPYPVELNNSVQNFITSSLGLTKRELFAAMAMQGLFSRGENRYGSNTNDLAEYAVSIADALLTELNK